MIGRKKQERSGRMTPEDIVKIARDQGWKNEDYIEAIYFLSKEIARPSGEDGTKCFICAGEGTYMGVACTNCQDV